MGVSLHDIGFFRLARAACLGAALLLVGGCVFAPAGKRGNVEDELEMEKELTLRALDGADAASALPSLLSLADNAGRMDEVGMRIQAMMLIARTLDAEAAMWDGEQERSIRKAARRQADKALREAEDWKRFEPGNKDAVLLELDARILRMRMDAAGGPELEGVLRLAAGVAAANKDYPRAAAWQFALCRIEGEKGYLGEARKWFGLAAESLGKLTKKPGADNDPTMEALRLACAETEADLAAYEGRSAEALALYDGALERARKMRRRAELQRILFKQADMAERLGDAERAEWYRRRGKGVAKKSPKSPGERLLGGAGASAAKPAAAAKPAMPAAALETGKAVLDEALVEVEK